MCRCIRAPIALSPRVNDLRRTTRAGRPRSSVTTWRRGVGSAVCRVRIGRSRDPQCWPITGARGARPPETGADPGAIPRELEGPARNRGPFRPESRVHDADGAELPDDRLRSQHSECPTSEERVSETHTEADEFEDQDPRGELTIAMVHGEPVVVCWRERDVDAALAAAHDYGAAGRVDLVRRDRARLLSGLPGGLGGGTGHAWTWRIRTCDTACGRYPGATRGPPQGGGRARGGGEGTQGGPRGAQRIRHEALRAPERGNRRRGRPIDPGKPILQERS